MSSYHLYDIVWLRSWTNPRRYTCCYLRLLVFVSLAIGGLLSAQTFAQDVGDQTNTQKRDFIKGMMKHAWQGYANYAWGYNELRPISKRPHDGGVFGGYETGASIVDAIDTLYIMGLHDEYQAARKWIEESLDINKFQGAVSVFETNIRYVGGLLSIFALTKDHMFVDKAVQMADKLLPAFSTSTGIPYSYIHLDTGNCYNNDYPPGASILSEYGSIHLEFIYLSFVTGDPKYREKALKIRETVRKAAPRLDGLYNNYMNQQTGQWHMFSNHISMGALGDSFYEYLIKSYVQTDGQDVEAYHMYMNAMKAFENNLMFTSKQSGLLYLAKQEGISTIHKMDMLACFAGGMFALGATKSAEPIRSLHMSFGIAIANTCHESCVRTESQLGPELFSFEQEIDAVSYGGPNYYILRPEIIESYFYLWRYTRDSKYRDWAWDYVMALERCCRTEAGYSGLKNVDRPDSLDDVQQSFFLAEVLKYLYLMFSDDSVINLNEWVLNTEAHPLPIIKHFAA